MKLEKLGWSEIFEKSFTEYRERGMEAARVAAVFQNCCKLYTEYGEMEGRITGKMMFEKTYPAVGDWVAVSIRKDENGATINSILPRKSSFSRKTAGNRTDEQIISANIDTVFIVMSLNEDFNIRRLERYLAIVWESGAVPVVVLSKADLCMDIEEKVAEVESVAIGIDVCIISSIKHEGISELNRYITGGKSVSLVGSSGAGKSTLVNTIIGEERMAVNAIREDDARGRHTTTHREMIILEDGVLIDNPGMREIQLLDIENGVRAAFDDIAELAEKCRFSDCWHESEPGCAVHKAIAEGELDIKRFENYKKLQKEIKYIEGKNNLKANQAEKAKWKNISKYQKKLKNGGE